MYLSLLAATALPTRKRIAMRSHPAALIERSQGQSRSAAESLLDSRAMAEDERTRRWQKLARYEAASDTIQVLRVSIAEVRNAPRDPEARRRLRAIAAEHGLWDQLAVLLGDEARAAEGHPERAAAFYEELADVYENLDQPLETIAAMEQVAALDPDHVERLDRLAWLYRRAGAWAK